MSTQFIMNCYNIQLLYVYCADSYKTAKVCKINLSMSISPMLENSFPFLTPNLSCAFFTVYLY